MIEQLISLQEGVAFAMWKHEAMRAAPNVGKNRTREGFKDESKDTRAKWIGLASAAILEITHPEQTK